MVDEEVKNCIAKQVRPQLEERAARVDGTYYRNLTSSDVGAVYSQNPNAGPRRIKTKRLRSLEDIEQQRGFSVNCARCMPCKRCCILMHPNAGQFKHVWEIDLAEFNARCIEAFGDYGGFEVVYDPVEDLQNFCHFLMMPAGELSCLHIPMLLEHLEEMFPPKEQKLPKTKAPKDAGELIAEATTKYLSVATVHENVVS